MTSPRRRFFSFNDFHGALDAPTGSGGLVNGTPAGGAEYLATTLEKLRAEADAAGQKTLTVGAGDMVGATPLLSAAFHDEPSIETLNLLKMDVTSVGNHEFDEGVDELLRLQNGGCHPTDGCQDGDPYFGADFPYLAANTVYNDTGETILPAWTTRVVQGVRVGFIGMTLEGTPSIVNPAGITEVSFLDEIETANQYADELLDRGVEAIVLLIHEGGQQNPPPATIDPSGCANFTGPLVNIVAGLDPEFDLVVSGHTHRPYVCSLLDSGARADPDHQRRLQRHPRHRHHRDAEQVVRRLHQPECEERDRGERRQEPGRDLADVGAGRVRAEPGTGRPGDQGAHRRVPRRRRPDRQPHRRVDLGRHHADGQRGTGDRPRAT